MAKRRSLDRRKPHPKWGATKEQGKRNAELRTLANRIHELEVENKRLASDSAKTEDRERAESLIVMCVPNGEERDTIGALFFRIPIHRAIEYGVLDQMLALGKWFRRVQQYVLATGKDAS